MDTTLRNLDESAYRALRGSAWKLTRSCTGTGGDRPRLQFPGFSRQDGTRLSFVDAALAHAARTRADGQILTFDAEFRKLPSMRVQNL